MQAAYGVNLISFGGVKGTGAGQTIAIVDAYNDPTILADANTFSSAFGLPGFNTPNGPTLQVLNETGGASLANVPNATPGTWDVEEALDVEWAHAIAPQANLILFEAQSNALSDLLIANQTAAATAGVSVVSNSWGTAEFAGETSDDADFTTPVGHPGVTFLASSGDAPGIRLHTFDAVSGSVAKCRGGRRHLTQCRFQRDVFLRRGLARQLAGKVDTDVSQYEPLPSFQLGRDNFGRNRARRPICRWTVIQPRVSTSSIRTVRRHRGAFFKSAERALRAR